MARKSRLVKEPRRSRPVADKNTVLVELSRLSAVVPGDLGLTFHRVTEATAHTLDVERASVWLFTEEATHIRCVDLYERATHIHTGGQELSAKEYPAYFRALESQRFIRAAHARTDPHTREFTPTYLTPLGITSMLDAPLRRGGRVVGVLCSEHVGAPREWTADDVGFAASIADLVVLALEADDRLRLTDALRRSEERFRTLVTSLDDIFFTLDTEQRHVEVYGRWLQASGFTADHFLGRTAREIVGPEAARVHEEANGRALAGEAVTYEWSAPGPQGPCHVQTSLSPIRDGEGRVTGVVGVGRDITELARAKEHQEALQSLTSRLSGPLGEDEVGLLVASESRRLFGHDAFVLDLFDSTEQSVRTLHAEDTPLGARVPEEISIDSRPLTPMATRLLETGEPILIDRGDKSPPVSLSPFGDIQRLSLSIMYAPIRWQSRVVGFVSAQSYTAGRYDAKDVKLLQTLADLCGGALARLHAERELKQRETQLWAAQKLEALGRLAGGVAHDFNNLLTVIIGYAEVARSRLPAGDATRGCVEDILKAALKAATLTRQLLAFGRRDAIESRTLSLNRVIRSMASLLGDLVGERIKLSVELSGDAGNVTLDSGHAEQIVMNLTLNARDAMPDGGRLQLRTAPETIAPVPGVPEALRPGEYVRLTVTDTGCGMDERTLSRLFEPFFTTKEKGKGTGLGLSTVYGIVRQAGGRITVQSRLGEGTTFTILLPSTHGEEEPEREGTRSRTRGGTETLLLVEDADVVRKLAREVLASHGYAVIEARGGKEALRLARGHVGPIHLLLTDVVMPGMSGVELADALKAVRPETRALLMSAYPEDSMTARDVSAAKPAFLEKPFTPKGLASKVREVLDHARADDEPTCGKP